MREKKDFVPEESIDLDKITPIEFEATTQAVLDRSELKKHQEGTQTIEIKSSMGSGEGLKDSVELIALYAAEAATLSKEINRYIKKIYAEHPELKRELQIMKALVDKHADIKSIAEKSLKKVA